MVLGTMVTRLNKVARVASVTRLTRVLDRVLTVRISRTDLRHVVLEIRSRGLLETIARVVGRVGGWLGCEGRSQ